MDLMQVFFPIPFVEYHPEIVAHAESDLKSAGRRAHDAAAPGVHPVRRDHASDDDVDLHLPREGKSSHPSRPLVVHKDQGHFDAGDLSIVGVYGSDFVTCRTRLADPGAQLLDVSSLFVAQSDLHLLRAVEPALRIRFHVRSCDPALLDADYARCLISRREGLASKAQLAALLLRQQMDREAHNRVVVL